MSLLLQLVSVAFLSSTARLSALRYTGLLLFALTFQVAFEGFHVKRNNLCLFCALTERAEILRGSSEKCFKNNERFGLLVWDLKVDPPNPIGTFSGQMPLYPYVYGTVNHTTDSTKMFFGISLR